MPGLGASFGRGAGTDYQQDLANSDCILIMGSNMAEAHPVGFRWPMKAKERGAKIIHVDPRFTRTSALADHFVGIRAGSDIAFLGALINYVLTHEKWFKEYVVAYTNAATIIEEGFLDTEELEGIFSGYDKEARHYDGGEGHWGYEASSADQKNPVKPGEEKQWKPQGEGGESGGAEETGGQKGMHGPGLMGGSSSHDTQRKSATDGPRPRDPTLQHPRCVMQILRRHFARYTPEMAAQHLRMHGGRSGAGGRTAVRKFGARSDVGHCVCRGLDAAYDGCADDPGGRDIAAFAGEHGKTGRGHHGDARALHDSRVNRHIHVV